MKHFSDRARKAQRPPNVEALRRALKRSLSDLREGWRRCGNQMCRRGKQCFGEGDFKCSGGGSPPRTFDPAEKASVMSANGRGLSARSKHLARRSGIPEQR